LVPSIHQTISGRKRFYKLVDVVPMADGDQIGFGITLDGKTLRTPARNPLILPNLPLAVSIAAEWDAQTDTRNGIQPVNMPMMGLACTAIDQVQIEPEIVINTCVRYLPTDAALFITTAADRVLLGQQQQHFLPVVDWLNAQLGINLAPTESMAGRISHPEETIMKVTALLRKMDAFSLTALQGATLESKSLVLSLAYIARIIDLEQMVAASRLEEEFQVEIWGVVEGGHDMDRLNNAVRISSVGAFMSMYHTPSEAKDRWAAWTS